MNPYVYMVEFNKDEQVWEVIRETLDSGTAGFIPDASLLVGTCLNENTAVNAAFQLQRYGVVTGAVPEGRPNPGGLPVVLGLQSLHVRSGAGTVGSFACSSALINDIDRLIDLNVHD